MARRLPEIFAKCIASSLRRVVAFLALLIILFLLLILLAPTILSGNFMQDRLKSTLSTSLHGPVNWSTLQLSWSQGIKLRNLTIGPASGTLRQARLAALDCRPGFGFGAKHGESFGVDLFLHLHDLSLELAPAEGSTPVPAATPATQGPDSLTALAQGLDRFATLSWPLPIDLRVDVAIDPVTILYHDQASGRTFGFEQGGLQVRIPSLERSPLALSLTGNVQVDHHELGALRLASEISGLVAPSGRIVPATAFLSSFVEFPGIVIKADGRLDQGQGLTGELHLDLAQIQRVVAPFLLTTIPAISGVLQGTLHARTDKEENLDLNCTLAGQKLSYSEVGPIDFDLAQQVKSDHRRQLVTLGGGVLMIPQLLEANWEASVEESNSPERHITVRLHQLDLNLDQALDLAAPLLPTGLPQLSGGHLQLRDLDLKLHGSQGEGEAHLAFAELLLSELRLVQPLGDVTAEGIALTATDLKIPLAAYFPTSVTTGLEWKVARLQLRGEQPLALQGLDAAGTLSISAIRPASKKEGLSAHGSFHHQLQLKSAEMTGVARLTDLANDLHLNFDLLADGGVTVEKLQLNTVIAGLSATLAGKELMPLLIQQTLQIDGVELLSKTVFPTIKNVSFSVASPDFLQVSGEGKLAAPRLLNLEIKSHLELRRLLLLAGLLLPEKLTASGTLTSQLQLLALIPDRPLTSGQAPLRSAKNSLALLKELTGSLQFDGVEIELPLADGFLRLGGIKTPQPFRLQSRKNGEEIDVSAAIDFNLRSGSIINGQSLPNEHGRITLNGEVRNWERAFFTESLQLTTLGMAQQGELSIAGLAALLDTPLPPAPATLLQRLDATLFGEIDLKLGPEFSALLPGVVASGKVSAGTRIDLRAGKSLRLHAYADGEELAVKSAKGVELNGLQAHFSLDRALQITNAATSREGWLPLSKSLIQPPATALPPLLAGEKQRLRDDLRGNSSELRSLQIKTLTLPLNATPMTITALETEIATGKEEVGMNFMQAELLGGTLRARALINITPAVPVLSVEALFTNLDLGRLDLPTPEFRPGQAENALSGEFSLSVPLLAEQRAFLEGLNLSLRLRHIGSKSLDRVLAQLDPYERNEAIMDQRKLLRRGELQGINVQVADGAFSLTGTVSAKGVSLALPQINRLRLADLPRNKDLAPILAMIPVTRHALEYARFDTIQIGAQGEISLRKEEK